MFLVIKNDTFLHLCFLQNFIRLCNVIHIIHFIHRKSKLKECQEKMQWNSFIIICWHINSHSFSANENLNKSTWMQIVEAHSTVKFAVTSLLLLLLQPKHNFVARPQDNAIFKALQIAEWKIVFSFSWMISFTEYK